MDITIVATAPMKQAVADVTRINLNAEIPINVFPFLLSVIRIRTAVMALMKAIASGLGETGAKRTSSGVPSVTSA